MSNQAWFDRIFKNYGLLFERLVGHKSMHQSTIYYVHKSVNSSLSGENNQMRLKTLLNWIS